MTSAKDIELVAAAFWLGGIFRSWAMLGLGQRPEQADQNHRRDELFLQEVEAGLCARTDNKDSAAPGRERCVTRGCRLCETGNAAAVNNPNLLETSNDIHQNARLQRFSRERGKDGSSVSLKPRSCNQSNGGEGLWMEPYRTWETGIWAELGS